jgi:hypothetical protein
MSLRAILAASVALAFAAPVLAQEAPAAPAAPAAAPAADPAEAAFEAEAEAFEANIQAMTSEMQAAAAAAGADSAKASTDLDAIAARYQPQMDAFAASLETFLALKMAEAPEEQRAQMAQIGPVMTGQIRSAPALTKAQILQAAAAPAAPTSE